MKGSGVGANTLFGGREIADLLRNYCIVVWEMKGRCAERELKPMCVRLILQLVRVTKELWNHGISGRGITD